MILRMSNTIQTMNQLTTELAHSDPTVILGMGTLIPLILE